MGFEDSQSEDEVPGEVDLPAEQETAEKHAASTAEGFRIAEGVARDIEDMLSGAGPLVSMTKAFKSAALANSALARSALANVASVNAAIAGSALPKSLFVSPTLEEMTRQVDQYGVLASANFLQTDLANILGPTFSAASGLAASLRMMDQLTPLAASVSQFAVTSNAVEQALGLGTLTSWRVSLEANSRIEARIRELAAPSPMFSELASVSRSLVDLTDWAVLRSPNKGLLGVTSGLPVSTWRTILAESVDDDDQLPLVLATGRTNLALLGSDLLTSTEADQGVISEGADRVESDVVEPWTLARQQVMADLYAALADLDRRIPELLDGAWDDIGRNGPAAAEKAANCAVEAIDRALRIAAPDEAVRAWHRQTNRPASEWEDGERAPQRLRVKYLCRDLGGSRDLVVSQVEALGAMVRRLRGRLEAAKHASQSNLVAVRALVCQTESVLITLFVGTSFPTN